MACSEKEKEHAFKTFGVIFPFQKAWHEWKKRLDDRIEFTFHSPFFLHNKFVPVLSSSLIS